MIEGDTGGGGGGGGHQSKCLATVVIFISEILLKFDSLFGPHIVCYNVYNL